MTFRSRSLLVLSVALLLLAPGSAASVSSTRSPASVPGCARDTVPPQVLALTLSAGSVDVTAASATVEVRVRVVDLAAAGVTPSGVRSVRASVEFRVRSGSATQFLRLRPSSDPVTWGGHLVVPRGALPGTWRVTEVSARDWAYNVRGFGAQSEWAQSQLGPVWQTTIDVADDTPDRQRPTIVDVSLSPAPIDTRAHKVTRRVELRVRDDVAVRGAALVLFHRYASDLQRRFEAEWTGRRGARFTGRVTVPRWLTDDTLVVEVSAWDANSSTLLSGDQLARRGWTSSIPLRSLEAPRPRLEKLVVGKPAGLRDGGIRIPVRATVDGGGAAVKSVAPSVWRRGASRGYHATNVSLVDGDRLHGRWRGAVVVSPCAGPGVYRLTVELRGQGGARRDVGGDAIRAAGAPPRVTLRALSGDDTDPRAFTSSAPANSLALEFSEGVRDVLPALTPVSSSTGDPLAVAAATCTTFDGAVVPCDTDEPVVRRVVLLLADPLDADEGWPALVLNLLAPVPQITDAGGNTIELIE
jgi:hypothetical protein